MNVSLALNEIERLTNSMPDMSPNEKVQAFTTLKFLIYTLDKDVFPGIDATMHLAQLIYPLKSLAGLDDNGKSKEMNQGYVWGSINKLRSHLSFDVN